jgi:light-regulated signal transduction histidine kinase (bacteriophytochrome)
MQPRISETGANITAAGLPVVQGDRVHLTQVFQNLLSNSLKYCRPDVTPRIEVSAQQDDSNWTITVRDNGIGFEPRHAERIFELFKRLHRENQYPGTGLGLAICRRIVERYGGQIWAEGKPGEGSAFHMKFLRGGGFDYLKDLSG